MYGKRKHSVSNSVFKMYLLENKSKLQREREGERVPHDPKTVKTGKIHTHFVNQFLTFI